MFGRLLKMVCLISLLVSNPRAYSQDEFSVDKEHLAGVVGAHLLSLEGWRTGDFLVRVSTNGSGRFFRWEENQDNMEVDDKIRFVEGVNASTVDFQSDLLYRVVFDFDSERCLIVGNVREVATVLDALDRAMDPIVRKKNTIFLLNDVESGAWQIRPDGKMYNSKQVKSVSYALFVANVPDIRFLGWNLPLTWDCDRLRTRLGDMRTEAIQEVRHVGQDVYQLRIKSSIEGVSNLTRWDVSRNLPVSYWIGTDRDKTTGSEGAAKWSEIDGLPVPVSSRFMNAHSSSFGSRDYSMKNEVAVDIHWFSLNQELSDEFFQKDLLSDQKKLDELLNQNVFEKQADDTANGDNK
jgi:hypothetical protein